MGRSWSGSTEGDWHEGSVFYRRWFDRHFPVLPASWLRSEMAWQSTIMANPEDVVVHRFADLAAMAVDAKKYDVTTFEICGWDIGGIDRGYPDYRPEPALGSADDFRAALRSISKTGVHPVRLREPPGRRHCDPDSSWRISTSTRSSGAGPTTCSCSASAKGRSVRGSVSPGRTWPS